MQDDRELLVFSGNANRPLAKAVCEELGIGLGKAVVGRFSDGEVQIEIDENVRGQDVFVIQPTCAPAAEHLVELLALVDALKRASANKVTAVVPYFGYARQDRRGRAGEAVGARVAADALVTAGADRLVVVDPHTAALEATSGVPVEMLTAVPALASALAQRTSASSVVVAPDLGAVKLAERFAAILRRPVAVVRKTRLTGATVRAEELVGDVTGRPTVIVDDMISTGGTIEAAVRVLLAEGAAPDITVAATHGLLVADALPRLARLPIRHLIVTDTLPPPRAPHPSLQIRSVAPLLADAIDRLHTGAPLDALLMHT